MELTLELFLVRKELRASKEREAILERILNAQPWCWQEAVDPEALRRLWPEYAGTWAPEDKEDENDECLEC